MPLTERRNSPEAIQRYRKAKRARNRARKRMARQPSSGNVQRYQRAQIVLHNAEVNVSWWHR